MLRTLKDKRSRASDSSGSDTSANQPVSIGDSRPPEELLATLQAARRTDTAGGLHFWEVARSLRCARLPFPHTAPAPHHVHQLCKSLGAQTLVTMQALEHAYPLEREHGLFRSER